MTSSRGSTITRAVIALATLPLILLVIVAGSLYAQTTDPAATAARHVPPEVLQWGFMAAAIVTGMAAMGAAYAVAVVGGAAIGAVAEKPEMAGRALVFIGLAEGIAIYGLIIAIMILSFLT